MRQNSTSGRVTGPQSGRKRRSAAGRVLYSLFFIFILAGAALAIAAVFGYHAYTTPGPLAANKVVDIEKGLSTPRIAKKLEAEGVISDASLFSAVAYTTGIRGRLKAGEYEFPAGVSMAEVAALIMSGKSIIYKLTLPEGWTSAMAVERIKADPILTGEVAAVPPEGSLMPDTYVFKRGTERQKLLDDMQAAQTELLDKVWQERNGLIAIKTKEEALVLASIVEKETGTAGERPLVASVFMNRLKKGMRLQSDPTIIYGIAGGKGKLDRALTKTDITTATPYNTYTIGGLPPGPIANPGRAALEAVVNPPDTGYLYFVADGSGGHAFASTLEEHNRNVAKWRALASDQVSASAEAAPVAEPAATTTPDPPAADTAPSEPDSNATAEVKQTAQPIPEPVEAAPAPEPPQVASTEPLPEPLAKPADKPAIASLKPPEEPKLVPVLQPGSIVEVAGKLVPIPKRKPKR